MGVELERRKENVEAVAIATPMQQGILAHSLAAQEQDPYFHHRVFSLEGRLNPSALEAAWQAACDRHAVLRTDYRWHETEKPVQIVYRRGAAWLQTLDWRSSAPAEQRAKLAARLREERRTGYDFRHGADLKLCLIQVAEQVYWLVWSLHHIALDGWSTTLVLNDVLGAYHANLRGEPPAAARPSRYIEYVDWVHRQDHAQALAYWRELLRGFDSPTALPVSAGQRTPGYFEQRFWLDGEATRALQGCAQAWGVTLNTLVQGAWALLLGRHSGSAEVVFGTTVSGRSPTFEGAEEIAGLFINTLPVRVRLPGKLGVREWLRGIQAQNAESRRFEHTPLAEVRRSSELSGDGALFDSVVVFENYPLASVLGRQPPGLSVRLLEREESGTTGRNNFPLSLIAVPGERLSLTLAYQCEHFEGLQVAELGQRLRHLLGSFAEAPERALGDIALPCAELGQDEWGESSSPDASLSVLHAFADAVARVPRALAVCCEARRLSYAELDVASDAVAQALRERSIGAESRVALVASRCTEFVVALLGTLKAGAAYVPLDPRLPTARLREIADDVGAALVLVAREDSASGGSSWAQQAFGRETLSLDELLASPSAQPDPSLPRRSVHPAGAAYVIYTSGSTGRPKGVVVSHGALSRYVGGLLARLDLRGGCSMAMVSTVSADLGHTVLFGALCSGGALHLIGEDRGFDPDGFAVYMAEHQVQVLKIAPTHLQALLQAREPRRALPTRALILGGELSAWPFVEALQALGSTCRIINHYGPTEATVGVCTFELGAVRPGSSTLPMGQPLSDVELYVLGRELERLAGNVAGELYIGGERLARGYWSGAALTADRFVPNPYARHAGGRLYRTGDRVRRGASGLLEFLGRSDRQVKIRGYRVELGEVEARLRELEAVREAVVVAEQRPEGGVELRGFVVLHGGRDSSEQDLRERLRASVADHMVPAHLSILQQLPVSANGKVDVAQLRLAAGTAPAETSAGAEARTATERALVEVWREVLKREQVGVTDNYFALGGDSILGLQMIARARKRGLKITPKQIFGQQTIRELAASLDERATAAPPASPPAPSAPPSAAPARSGRLTPADFPLARLTQAEFDALPVRAEQIVDIYPLSPMQQGMLFHSLFSPGAGVYVNQVSVVIDGLDAARFERAFCAVLARHDILRTSFLPDEALQIVHRSVPSCCVELDWSDRELDAGALRTLLREERARGFEPSRPPLQRVVLVRLGERRHQLIWTHHHVLIDGWSSARQIEEVFNHYLGLELPAVPAQYRDYIAWLAQRDQQASEGFWRKRLAGLDQPTLLGERSSAEAGHGQLESSLDEPATEQLRRFAGQERVTLNTLLQAAWLLILARHTGRASVAMGITVSGRPPELPGMESMLGPFIHSLPLIARLSLSCKVGAWLRELQQQNLELREHEQTPLHQIQRWAFGAGQPLFDSLLAFQNFPVDRSLRSRSHAQLQIGEIQNETPTNYALILQINAEQRLHFTFGYWQSHFGAEQIQAFGEQLRHLLAEICLDAQRPLGAISVATAADRLQLGTWTEARTAHAVERCLHERLEEAGAGAPDSVAIVCGSEQLSYSALGRSVGALAARLEQQGVGPDVLVGLAVERSPAMIIGMLAVLRAGGAYLPLDPELPSERLAYMIEDSRVELVLSERRLSERLPATRARVVCMDVEPEASSLPARPRRSRVQPENLAYCIYTSGSTGKPKGALITHANVLRLFEATAVSFAFGPGDCWTLFHSYAFDFSVWEVFGALLYAGRLVIVSREDARSPRDFWELCQREQVTVLSQTPSAFQQLVHAVEQSRSAGSHLRFVVFGGEALGTSAPRRWFELCGERAPQLVNMYGITETTVHVTEGALSSADLRGGQAPIGRPLNDLSTLLLDTAMEPVPIGAVGEIYVAGAGLARGYLWRPSLTAERFVPSAGGQRLYRTGDLARQRRDGGLEYLGRKDDQVKIRGHRIELGEIEARLRELAFVKEAVVLAHEDAPGEKRLLGYVVPDEAQLVSSRSEHDAATRELTGQWRSVFETTYAAPADSGQPSFVGWNDSYGDRPIPEQEMRRWLDTTIERLEALEPRHVLELGCGVGLIVQRLAARAQTYVGTDLSLQAVAGLTTWARGRPGLGHIELLQREATDFRGLSERRFDTVILNSVVQYFPNAAYLIEVLERAVATLSDGGHVFVGDVRSLPLLSVFHASVQLARAADHVSVGQLRQRIAAALARDTELVIDPRLFEALAAKFPGVRARIALKRGGYDNELSRYRYDVVLRKAGLAPAPLPTMVWDASRPLEELRSLLEQRRPARVVVAALENRRVSRDVAAARSIEAAEADLSVAELRSCLADVPASGHEPDVYCELARELGYDAEASYVLGAADGRFDLELTERTRRGSRVAFVQEPAVQSLPDPSWAGYTNDPALARLRLLFVSNLRDQLEQRLPAYMVPAQLTVIDALPLTSNGKLDRKLLLGLGERDPEQAYIRPRTETERALARIWQEVLGVTRVSVRDDFFELGGHSLLATRVVTRIARALHVELPLRLLFEHHELGDLAACIDRGVDGQRSRRPALRPIARGRPLPLAAAQRRLWFLWRLEPASSAYNITSGVRLRGALDRAALQRALEGVMARHEVLRTHFVENAAGEPEQLISAAEQVSLVLEDLSSAAESERAALARERVDREARLPFDLEHGPVVRALLLQLGAQEHILLVVMHHIVSDGWSTAIVVNDFRTLYAGYAAGAEPRLPELELQYADYAAWQTAWLEGGERARQLAYWHERLGRSCPLLQLPYDRRREGIASFSGADHEFDLDAELTGRLRLAARERSVTLFVLLLAGFSVVASERSGQRRFRLGTDTANRNALETEGVVGFFVNQVVLDIALDGPVGVAEWLTTLNASVVSAVEHQDLPFDELVAALRPTRDGGKSPFFKVKVLYQEQSAVAGSLPGLDLSALEVARGGAELDLVIDLSAAGDRIHGKLQYAEGLFEGETIRSLAEELVAVLRALTNPVTLDQLLRVAADARSARALASRQSSTASASAKADAIWQQHPLKQRASRGLSSE